MLANLKALRTAQGLSQRALADFVKVSQQSINQYENRDTEPDIAVLTRIADYFGVSIDYLVGHDPAAGELIPTNLTDAELRQFPFFRSLNAKALAFALLLCHLFGITMPTAAPATAYPPAWQ